MLLAALACVLALRTSQAVRVWENEDTLWTQAHRIAPDAPRPLINLAWVALRRGALPDANDRLAAARAGLDRLTTSERAWAADNIAATQAVIWMRQGRLRAAAGLMAHAPEGSERAALCAHFVSVCALALE